MTTLTHSLTQLRRTSDGAHPVLSSAGAAALRKSLHSVTTQAAAAATQPAVEQAATLSLTRPESEPRCSGLRGERGGVRGLQPADML